MWAIAILSVAALLLDLVVYVAALVGFNPQDWVRPEWVGVAGFFGLLGLMLVIANVVAAYRKRRARARGVLVADIVHPWWFRLIARVVVVFALANLVWFGFIRGPRGDPVERGIGVYAVDPGHAHPDEPITREQYMRYRRYQVCAMAGLFLAFYLPIAFEMICMARGKDFGEVPGSARLKQFRWVFVIRRG